VPYNLVQYSEQFDNATWLKNASSITANTATAPNGTMTADSLIEDNTNAVHQTIQTSLLSAGGVYTSSVYLKPNGRNWVAINITAAANYTAWFDVQNGVVGTIQSNITSASITAVGNGWFRCTLTANTGAVAPRISLNLSTGNNVLSYVGNGTSGIFVWGAQLVEGTDALPYQLTETRLNRPRVDFSLGGCPNLLLEPQRTNLALWSEQFDNAAWVKTNSIITANSTISPSGILNADKLVGNGSNPFIFQDGYSLTGVTATLSVYAKKGELNWLRITNSGFSYSAAWFNLNSGTIGTVSGTASPTATITDAGNGWYRCTMTVLFDNVQAADFAICCTNANNTTTGYTGNGVDGIYIWGAQLEAGAYPTSYIPTSSATVTRNSDTFALSNVFTNNLISSAGGTWFVGLKNNILLSRDNSGNTMTLGDTGSNNAFRFRNDGTPNTQLRVQKVVGGTASDLFLLSTSTVKIAIKWNGSTCDVFVNGIKVVSASAFTPTILENLTTAPQVPIYINSMSLYNTAISDAECIAITTL
jgi:hypothetical protein